MRRSARCRDAACRTSRSTFPSGRHARGRTAPTSRSSRPMPSGSSSACSTRPAAQETARLPLPEVHRSGLSRLLPGSARRPGLWPARARPLGAGARPSLQPGEAAARPLRQGRDRRLRLGRAEPRSTRKRRSSSTRAIPRPSCRRRVVAADPRAGDAGAARHAWAADASSTRRTCKGLTKLPPGRARARCAAPIWASPIRRCSTIWSSSASPRSS